MLLERTEREDQVRVDHTSDAQPWSSGEFPSEASTSDAFVFVCVERESVEKPTHASWAFVRVVPEIADEPSSKSRLVIWLELDADPNASSVPIQPAQ
ncbi:hypothetical protein [Streptomyces sp. NPDC047000]|uniref:hypothetical protein n=1 Tax=Streptomyces sp. NPDC047000 TaxID=3155474 RepID=UPI003408A38F